MQHLFGVDHVVVTVRDLDKAAAQWKRLGFTLSPRGTHSPHVGTGNYTIMLQDDYLELLGVLTPTEQNAPTRRFLETGEGIERTAFTTDDAAAGAALLVAQGLQPIGPVHFGRPVVLPGGGSGEARFSVFRWPLHEAPGGMRIFACQHLTRETVWSPSLLRHANGAKRIVRIEVLADDAAAAAAHMGRLIDSAVARDADAWCVASGFGRADFHFLDARGFAKRYPANVREGAVATGAAAIVLASDDLDAARGLLAGLGTAHDGLVSIAACAANGVVLSFAAA